MTTTEPDMEGLLTEIGVRLGHVGDKEIYGICPGHKEMLGREDRSPDTWSVNRYTGVSYCFSCGWSSTLPELVERQTGTSRWGALTLMRNYGIDPTEVETMPASIFDKPQRKANTPHLPESALDQFVPPPAKELASRNLTADTAEYFGVLWDPDERAWILPIRLVGGALIGWQMKKQKFVLNYPEGVSQKATMFGADKFPSGATAILVESPLDVLRLWDAGFEGALATMGANVTDDQMRLLMSLTSSVLLGFDNDDAGKLAMIQWITGQTRRKRRRGAPTKMVWAAKFDEVTVANYSHTDAKDFGDMTDAEIERSLVGATDGLDWAAANSGMLAR